MQPKLGILQLQTTFPRPIGDVGNNETWGDIPVVIKAISGADMETIVGGSWSASLANAFIAEGRRMIAEDGVVALITSCGFVSQYVWSPN